jgi:hypothetical protein
MKKFFALLFLILISHNFARAAETPAQVLIARKLCDLQDARINESSGLAASRRYAAQNLLWTHNDSGGETRIFCVNLKGQTVAEVLLQNATNIDWEDLAISGDKNNSWIYAGDIGDNLERRESITIYRICEPQFDPDKTGQVLNAQCEAMTLKYPDAPHNCEALMANARGEILLVSKNGGASKIFKTPQPFQNGATQMLEQVGEYSFTGATAWGYLTTGGSISADEKHLVIRTYTHAYEWKIPAQNDWKAMWKEKPRIFELAPSKQGESICYSASGAKFFTTSEGIPCPLFELENEE